jgi:hypothetical protein
MSTPLKARGESEAFIGGRKIRLKASFASLCAVEEALGTSVLLIAMRVKKSDIRIRDVALMLSAFATEAGENLSLDEAGKLLFENGYLAALPALVTLLTDSIRAGNGERDKEDLPNGAAATG